MTAACGPQRRFGRLLRAGFAVAVLAAGLAAMRPAAALAEDPACVGEACPAAQPAGPAQDGAPAAPEASPALPAAAGLAAAAPRPAQGRVAPGIFDFYVLSLSWSPGFCASGGAERAVRQCAAGANLGFVVHGLWPQYTHGFPSDCEPAGRYPSRQALDGVRGLYPDEGLARYEWRKHGTCTGKSPSDYFADVQRARAGVTIPQPFVAPHEAQHWAPIDIARAFVAANPGLRTDTMAITCRQNALEEVRICLTKDLRAYISCPEVSRASCRRTIDVPPVN